MKRYKPNPILTHDHGMRTIEAVAAAGLRYEVFPVVLDDGDTVGVTGEMAEGLLMIRLKLSPSNKSKMQKMNILELLNVHSKAVEDGILIPSKLKLSKNVASEK